MIQLEEAQNLIIKFISLRENFQKTNFLEDEIAFRKHEEICIEKFKYLVTMRTGKYKQFSNYEDLNQEGLEALVKSMKNYNPNRGNFFWWSHKYIDTRISRCANLHTTIRYPLKVAKKTTPHKESIMPILVEHKNCPDKELEHVQVTSAIHEVLDKLSPTQNEIIKLAYGLNGEKPMSINKICKQVSISRLNCIKTINNALLEMKNNIKI